MKSKYSDIFFTCFVLLVIFTPLLYFLFQTLPESKTSFWDFVGRFSQWKPEILKGTAIIVIFILYFALLGIFVFLSKKELKK